VGLAGDDGGPVAGGPSAPIVVPSAAVRDEGTSYHYLPPAREVSASPEGVAAIEQVLDQHGVPHIVGKT